jgi:hypothetical protein
MKRSGQALAPHQVSDSPGEVLLCNRLGDRSCLGGRYRLPSGRWDRRHAVRGEGRLGGVIAGELAGAGQARLQ